MVVEHRAVFRCDRVDEVGLAAAGGSVQVERIVLQARCLHRAAASGERQLVAGILQEGGETLLAGGRTISNVEAADHLQAETLGLEQRTQPFSGEIVEHITPHRIRHHHHQPAGIGAQA